jgi:hypothetical protein
MCGTFACVAVTEDKRIFAWGDSGHSGAILTEVRALTDIATAMCGYWARVVVTNGTEGKRIFAWGDSGSGGAAPAAVRALTDVATAMCGGDACVAVTESQQKFAWGDVDRGGAVLTEVWALTNVATAMCEINGCLVVTKAQKPTVTTTAPTVTYHRSHCDDHQSTHNYIENKETMHPQLLCSLSFFSH